MSEQTSLIKYLAKQSQRERQRDELRRNNPVLQTNVARVIGALGELVQSYAELAALEMGDENPFQIDQTKIDLTILLVEFLSGSYSTSNSRGFEVKPHQLTEAHTRHWFKSGTPDGEDTVAEKPLNPRELLVKGLTRQGWFMFENPDTGTLAHHDADLSTLMNLITDADDTDKMPHTLQEVIVRLIGEPAPKSQPDEPEAE